MTWAHGEFTYLLKNSTDGQKIYETHKTCFWLERIRNFHKEFALLPVIEFNRKYTKLTKFGILVNKICSNTRQQYFQGVWENFGNSKEEEG